MSSLINLEDGMAPVFPITINKIGANNGGGNYDPTSSNNNITLDFPDSIMADLDMCAAEVNLLTTATDTTTGSIVEDLYYTFYDSVSDRYVGADSLIRSAMFQTQGGGRTIDVSPVHNVRMESMNCFSDSWVSKNAKSLMGTAVCPNSNNNDFAVSTLLTGTGSLIQYPLRNMFGVCRDRTNFYTKDHGKCTITITLDPTKSGAFKALSPLSYPTAAGTAYTCTGSTVANAGNVLTVLTLPAGPWGATAANAPFAAAGSVIRINYEDLSAGLIGKVARFKSVLASVTSFVVDNVTLVGTLTIPAVAVSVDNAANGQSTIQNVTVQAMRIPLPQAPVATVPAMFRLANIILNGAGAIGAVTTVSTAFTSDANVKQVYADDSTWLLIYTSNGNIAAAATTQTVKYKYVSVTGTLSGGNPSAGTLTFPAAVTLGIAGEVLTNAYMIPINYNPDTLAFSYQITDANLILYQNVLKPTPPPPTYTSWVYDPVVFQQQSEQTFQALIRPNCLMLLILTPLNGSVVSVRDTVSQLQMYMDEVPTTNIPLIPGTDEYNAIVMVRNYGALSGIIDLESIVPDLALTNTSSTVIPMIVSQLYEGGQVFTVTFRSSGNLTQKNGYIFQLIEKTL